MRPPTEAALLGLLGGFLQSRVACKDQVGLRHPPISLSDLVVTDHVSEGKAFLGTISQPFHFVELDHRNTQA